jgi:16S rRNA (cytosine967-C5)-methyltransferase
MLEALWPRLAPGGLLLYATCSVFKEEGREVVAAFAAHTPDLCDARTPDGWALLPCRDEGLVHDGFYYARLRKRQA